MGSPFGGQDLLTNQRAAPRVVFHRKGHLIGPDGRPIPVKTFDISSSDIGLLSPHPIEAKRIFALNVFTLRTALPEIAVQGLVAYCMLSGTQGYRVGLQYTSIPAQVKSLIDEMSANAL